MQATEGSMINTWSKFPDGLPLLELQNNPKSTRRCKIQPPEIIETPIISTQLPLYVKTEKLARDLQLQPKKPTLPKFKRKVKKRTTRKKPLKIRLCHNPDLDDDDFGSRKGEYDRELSKKLGFKARRVPISMEKGRKPRVTKRWKLFCAHCETLFFARPTPKNSRYVVNHNCCDRRKQYIIGVKTRGCTIQHPHACIQRLV